MPATIWRSGRKTGSGSFSNCATDYIQMLFTRKFKEFVELLDSNKVEYLVVGAFTVAWHGHARFTGDLDIWIRPESENAGRMLVALGQFGFGSLDINLEDLATSGQIIQLGVQPNRIDLITSISGVAFEDA